MVDLELGVARLRERPFLNYELNKGDLVEVEQDEKGHWHVVRMAPTA